MNTFYLIVFAAFASGFGIGGLFVYYLCEAMKPKRVITIKGK